MKQLTYLLFALSSIASAQFYNPFTAYYPQSKKTIGIHAEYDLGSNAVNTDFVNSLYLGKSISKEQKDAVSSKLNNTNRMGGNLNQEMYYRYKPDSSSKKNIGYWVAIKNRGLTNAKFSRDFFNLTFYGNKQFEDKTAILSDFNFNLLQFQQIQGGVSKKINKGEATYGLGVSLLNGQNYQSLSLPKAELYTAPNGEYLDFRADAIYLLSDSSKTALGTTNGVGFGVDVYADIPYKTKKDREERIIIEIRDMGMIWWNTNSLKMDRDTTYHYDGVYVPNLFNLQNQTFGNGNKDSVIQNLQPLHKKNFASTLPASLAISTISTYGKLQLIKGFRYRFNANAKVNIFLNANYFFSKHFMFSLGASYGGYSKVNFYCGAGLNVGKGIILHVASNNIEGFIVPKKSLGQGLYASLLKCF